MPLLKQGLINAYTKRSRRQTEGPPKYDNSNSVIFTYIKDPFKGSTFGMPKVKAWTEDTAEGKVLNLFSGSVPLYCDEIRNDIDAEAGADFTMDALDFLNMWRESKGPKFDTVLFDPPQSYRKHMYKWKGRKASLLKVYRDRIVQILAPCGIVISFGCQTVSMGKTRGFAQEEILLIAHGGSLPDTIVSVERWTASPLTKKPF